MTTQLATLEERFNTIDNIAVNFLSLNSTGAGSFALAIQTASAMKQLRELLTPDAMAPIMELMNSPLGFLTDKDPKKPIWKNGQEIVPKPYAVDVVRDCIIEATLRGIPLVGNNMNIISARTYVTKDGFGFLLKKITGLTDLKIVPGVPKNVGESGALVEMVATWKKDGKEDSLTRTLPIRVNSQMGADAILGKAERKMRCAIYNQITGSNLSDGEAEDAADSAKPANVTQVTTPTTVAPPPVPKKNTPTEKAPGESSSSGETQSRPSPASAAKGVESAKADPGPFGEEKPIEPKATLAEGIANLCKASGVTEARLIAYLKSVDDCDANAQALEDVAEDVLTGIKASWVDVLAKLQGKFVSSEPATPPADADLLAKVRALAAENDIPEEKLVDWLVGKRFIGPNLPLEKLPESRLVWLLNNKLVEHKAAILAGPQLKK